MKRVKGVQTNEHMVADASVAIVLAKICYYRLPAYSIQFNVDPLCVPIEQLSTF